MNTLHALDEWARWLTAAGRAPQTIALRTYHVRRVMNALGTDPWCITTEQLVMYLSSTGWARETMRAYRASLRSFYEWARITGRRQDDPGRLIPSIPMVRSLPRPTPEILFREALAKADDRVWLMVQLAGNHGLRRGEIARLHSRDLVPDLVGYHLVVHGKGGHIRHVPLTDDVAAVLRSLPEGWVFPSSHRAGQHLTPHYVGKLVSAVLPDGWTCHTLRHRCGTLAYRHSKDLRAVQELLGHSSSTTTELYTKVEPASVRNLVNAVANF